MVLKKSVHALWTYINYKHPRFLGIDVRELIANAIFLKKDLHYVRKFKWGGEVSSKHVLLYD